MSRHNGAHEHEGMNRCKWVQELKWVQEHKWAQGHGWALTAIKIHRPTSTLPTTPSRVQVGVRLKGVKPSKRTKADERGEIGQKGTLIAIHYTPITLYPPTTLPRRCKITNRCKWAQGNE